MSPEKALTHVASLWLPALSYTPGQSPVQAVGIAALDPCHAGGTPTMLEIAFNRQRPSLCLPTSQLLTDRILDHNPAGGVLHLRWELWSHKVGRSVCTERDVPDQQVYGLHWRRKGSVLDFNELDAARDVYAPLGAFGNQNDARLLPSTSILGRPTIETKSIQNEEGGLWRDRIYAQCRWSRFHMDTDTGTRWVHPTVAFSHLIHDDGETKVSDRLAVADCLSD